MGDAVRTAGFRYERARETRVSRSGRPLVR